MRIFLYYWFLGVRDINLKYQKEKHEAVNICLCSGKGVRLGWEITYAYSIHTYFCLFESFTTIISYLLTMFNLLNIEPTTTHN